MAHFKITNLSLLANKVQDVFKLIETLSQENSRLKKALKSGKTDAETIHRMAEMESEIRRLKKENKTLKEREKLIKNKTERLAVKLEEIDL